MPGFTVAIVGRPNVGKSTLFNRLLEERKAIVEDTPGVTRDRQYGIADWNGKSFNLIDTGGFVSKSDDVFEIEIKKQVEIAVDEANLILFVVDTMTGVTAQDQDMADVLRRSTTPVLLVVNKVDNAERALYASEFYSLGFEHTFYVSSISGSGTGELLDELTSHIPAQSEEEEVENAIPKFIIIGQPNAGKSTLLNALVGEERTIVSNIPGTTRDTIHTHYKQFGKEFVLIDTAGLRKKKNVHEDLEFYSVIRAVRAMDDVDVCFIVIDAENGITAQDVNIFSLAARKGKGIVILVNKWDLIAKETNTARDYEKQIKQKISPFTDVPVLFISAKEKQRIFQAMEKGVEVYENRQKKISTSKLNDILLPEIERYPPPMSRGHNIKIKFITQLPVVVPSFAFFANYPEAIKEPYRNFLENKIREYFNYSGVPVRVFFRKK
ncbi:MAG TPA: ribosome biogenesis GTPase Der [Flavipsychrobacter sp.]|nr:ribosome biogenesis GTPase Der [Flavipsychrobacter sp.]